MLNYLSFHGSSRQVYPISGYVFEIGTQGGKVAVFNLVRGDDESEVDFHFLGPCAETLPQIFANGQPWVDDILKLASTTP